MRSVLHLKFLGLYIVFAFLSLFTVSLLTETLIENRLEEDESQTLYREATLLADDYLPAYFTGQTSLSAVENQLEAMSLYMDASVWFTDTDGVLIASANVSGTSAPEEIADFDPAEVGGNQSITGTYHGYFEEEVITVIVPVIRGFSTVGYLLIHSPLSGIAEKCAAVMQPVYITLIVILFFALIFLIGLYFFVYRPLQKITEAAKQYASGNLEYEIPVSAHDEMGDLSASLTYMAARLQDMDDYQKKIVGNVSHDFRSPLTSIKGYVEAMADGTIPPELYGKYLDIILFETERLSDLTADLLTLNAFDTNEALLDKSAFDVQKTIKSTAQSFEGVCIEKHISVQLLLLPGDVRVYADRRKIQQVLYNLIDNAIKFSDNDSTVTIEVSRKAEKIFISVKDTGVGIAKEDLNKIWERFYKSDRSRGRDKKGTGLGLSIVKEILQMHDENITVISTEGVGTEFIFSLPENNS